MPDSAVPETVRIVIVDDHPLWREGVAAILSAEEDFDVVAQGASAADALRLAGDEMPDLMLLDVSMEGGGINAAREISATFPECSERRQTWVTPAQAADMVQEPGLKDILRNI